MLFFLGWYLAMFTSGEAIEEIEQEKKKRFKSKRRRDQVAELYSLQEARQP